ncbi:MAG TPA: S9 family peptidase, partial [Caulobacteraceae bacterium]
MRLAAVALIAMMTTPVLAAAQTPPADPYIWLEEASSPRAMAWVEAHNKSIAPLEADARYRGFYDTALALAAAKDRIPAPQFLHGEIYNFWQDGDHLRGYWRKTSLSEYRAAAPKWTTVLDIDALGKTEGKSWVFKGLDCLQPQERLCLVSLSDGGEDAVEIREF